MAQTDSNEPGDVPERSVGRVLDLVPIPDSNGVAFTIDEHVQGRDVLVTLLYTEPDEDLRYKQIQSSVRYGIEEKDALKNLRVKIDDVEPVSDQVSLERFVVFGDNPDMDDLTATLEQIYGEESKQKLGWLLASLVDRGAFKGVTIHATVRNELAQASPDEIDREMSKLTDDYYGELDL